MVISLSLYMIMLGLSTSLQIVRMPPKKKVEDERPVLIGRMGTNLKIGIVGLPNVGFVGLSFLKLNRCLKVSIIMCG